MTNVSKHALTLANGEIVMVLQSYTGLNFASSSFIYRLTTKLWTLRSPSRRSATPRAPSHGTHTRRAQSASRRRVRVLASHGTLTTGSASTSVYVLLI